MLSKRINFRYYFSSSRRTLFLCDLKILASGDVAIIHNPNPIGKMGVNPNKNMIGYA